MQCFLAGSLDLVGGKQSCNRLGDFLGTTSKAYGSCNGGDLPHGAAYAKVICVDELSVDPNLLAFDTDIGDPVLAATVRATCDVQSQVLSEIGKAILEFFRQPAREAFCFRQCELAELRSGAGNRSAQECGTGDGETVRRHLSTTLST